MSAEANITTSISIKVNGKFEQLKRDDYKGMTPDEIMELCERLKAEEVSISVWHDPADKYIAQQKAEALKQIFGFKGNILSQRHRTENGERHSLQIRQSPFVDPLLALLG